MVSMRLLLPCLVFSMLLSACGIQEARVVAYQEPILFTLENKSRPIKFSGMKYKLPRGKNFGKSFRVGILTCDYPTDLYWVNNNSGYFNNDALEETFKAELENANYVVTNDPDAFQQEAGAIDPELMVTALVRDLNLQICQPEVDFWTGQLKEDIVKGNAYLKIEWRVFDGFQEKIIFTTTTEGYVDIKKPRPGSAGSMITDAFAVAVNNLMSKEEFHKISSQNFVALKQKSKHAAMVLNGVAIVNTKAEMDTVKESVATVAAGSSHGSGFVIADGYILTNNHVVGGNKRVKVIASTGLELNGHVLRTDAYRDVALIKIEGGYLKALPVKTTPPKTGQAVYAIGSPQYKELSSTVTKGIVSSSNRIWKDKKSYIQADVSIYGGNSGGALVDEKGNVVGISVAGILDKKSGGMSSLNLFIPIKEGLEALNLEVQQR